MSVVPLIDGHENQLRGHGVEEMREIKALILEDRRKRFKTGEGGYIPMCAIDHHKTPCTWPFKENYEVFMKLKNTVAPAHVHRNTIESVELVMAYYVYPFLPKILNIPTLMVVAEGDDLCHWDIEIQAFHQIASPVKKIVILPKVTHMSIYSEKTHLEMAAKACADWAVEHLAKSKED